MLTMMLLLDASLALLGAGMGASVVTLGAAFGIGKIGAAAMEAIARQPEASNKIQTAMILPLRSSKALPYLAFWSVY